MRGFVTGDEIELWPIWRADDHKAKGVRATLINWDADGITVSLEREPGVWSFVPWCQVRLIRKALSGLGGAREPGLSAPFAWNRAPEENVGTT